MDRDLERIRELLPSYEIGGEIGRGGWGKVREGRHRQLQREVAIKQLPDTFAADPEVRARFVAEARLLASLDHPHIVPAHDFIEREGVCLLIMEKLAGGSMWDRFTQVGLSPETTCAAGLAAAAALHHAHERGILHRDVKPHNLLISSQEVMKVADFGIAKVLDGGLTMATRAGAVLGTPAYMAPEQALGEPLQPTTDIYALGVTLYHFLAGRLPFEEQAGSPAAMLYQRVHSQPVSLHEAAPEAAQPVVEAVMRALAQKPEDRYQTAEEFGIALAGAAGEAFGAGWLNRAGARLVVGGPLAAAANRHSGVPTPARMKVVPADVTVAAPQSPPPKEELVEVARLPVPEEVLSARPSLERMQTVVRQTTSRDAERAMAEVERIQAGSHAVGELELLQRHRAGEIRFRDDEVEEVERLLGGAGTSPAARLGLPADAGRDELRQAAFDAIARWRRREQSPLTPLPVAKAAETVIRSCEGVLAQLDRTG